MNRRSCSNGLRGALAARWVIEAYWVGNELLDRVDLTTSATR
ncbi:MAG: hypothetical protein ACRDYX_03180 [Egibacteraceae bacterium]